jgi:hypothetical protein
MAFINGISLKQALRWLTLIPTLFYSPRIFFDLYYAQPAKAKLSQVIIYSTILFLTMKIIFPDENSDIFRVILFAILSCIVLSIILCLTAKIMMIARSSFLDILSFVYLLSLYGIFFSYIFLVLFLKNEDYTFMLISNIFTNSFMLAGILGYWIVIRLKFVQSVGAVVLTIAFMNISMVFLSLLAIDPSHDSPKMDPFLAEIHYFSEQIKEMGGIPFTRSITYVSGESRIDSLSLMNSSRDTLVHFGQKGVDLFKLLAKENVKKLDSLKKNMHFKKTRDLFEHLKQYNLLTGSMFDYPPCDTCLVSSFDFLSEDSVLIKSSREYLIDSIYLRDRIIFDRKINRIYELKDRAESPSIIISWMLSPYYIIGQKFGMKHESKSVIF